MEKAIKTQYVDEKHVSCDGDTGALGHPKIYLEIKKGKNSIECPYCGKTFILKQHKAIKPKS